MNAEAVSKRLTAGPVFLRNEFEGAVLRSTTKGKFYARFPGKEEYEINFSTNLVTEALLDWVEITESTYERF